MNGGGCFTARAARVRERKRECARVRGKDKEGAGVRKEIEKTKRWRVSLGSAGSHCPGFHTGDMKIPSYGMNFSLPCQIGPRRLPGPSPGLFLRGKGSLFEVIPTTDGITR